MCVMINKRNGGVVYDDLEGRKSSMKNLQGWIKIIVHGPKPNMHGFHSVVCKAFDSNLDAGIMYAWV